MSPDWGLNLQSRHVPQPGIEPMTLWFAGQHSNQLSHTNQGEYFFLIVHISQGFSKDEMEWWGG